jgi:uncharacterized protein YkwD
MNEILIAIALWFSMTIQPICTAVKTVQPVVETATMNDSLIDVANIARANAGCEKNLVPNDDLMKAAQARAEYVADGHWTHDGNWEQIAKFYKYQYIGEDMAKYYPDDQSVINAWLNSPKHKDVLLNCKSRESGVGRKGAFIIQLFGTR